MLRDSIGPASGSFAHARHDRDHAAAARWDNRSHALLAAFKAGGSTKMGARYSAALFVEIFVRGFARIVARSSASF